MDSENRPTIGAIIARIGQLVHFDAVGPSGVAEGSLLLSYEHNRRSVELHQTTTMMFVGRFVDESGTLHKIQYVAAEDTAEIAADKINRFLDEQ